MQTKFDAETNGATVGTTTGDGDDFTSVGSGYTVVAHPWGGVGAKIAERTITGSASQAVFAFGSNTGTATTRVVQAFILRVPTSGVTHVGNGVIGTIDTLAGTQACQIKYVSGPKLRMAPNTSEVPANASDSPTLGGDYLVFHEAAAGTTTSNGLAGYRVYDIYTGALVHSWSSSAQNCGTTELARCRFNGLTTSNVGGTWTKETLGDPQLVRLASGWPSPLPRATAAPQGVVSSSGWTVTGAANVALALQSLSTSEYGESASGTIDLMLNAISPLSAGQLTLGQQYATTLPSTRTVELVEGSTSRKSWSATPTGSWADENFVLDLTSATAITDWSYLKLRLTAA